jgi:hypothetical protein
VRDHPGMARARSFALLVALAVWIAACGEPGSKDERREILGVVDRARDAFVAGRADEACALLTDAGRERSREFVGSYGRGRSCKATIRELHRLDREPMVDVNDVELASDASFEVIAVDGSRATVEATAGGNEVTIELRRTPGGWLIDNSSNVPQGD